MEPAISDLQVSFENHKNNSLIRLELLVPQFYLGLIFN